MGQIYYWTIFFIPVIASFSSFTFSKKLSRIFFYLFAILLVCFIGFRIEIGGDWGSYLRNYFINAVTFDYLEVPLRSDYGFNVISYLNYKLGLPIHYFNLFVSFICIVSLFKFANQHQQKWFFIAISIPTFVTVVYMGFVKQGLATSFLILAYIYLLKNKNYKFILFSFFAVLIHKTALLMILFFLMVKFIEFRKYKIQILLLTIILLFSYPFLTKIFGNVLTYYVFFDRDVLVARGAPMRLFIHLVTVSVFLFYQNKMNLSKLEHRFYNLYSVLVIVSIFFVSNYSALVDRISIYFLPFQYVIFTKLVHLKYNTHYYNFFKIFIITLYGLIFFIWLNFSYSSHRWVPYKSIFNQYEGHYLLMHEMYYEIWNNAYGTQDFKKTDEFIQLKALNDIPMVWPVRLTDEELHIEYLRKEFDTMRRLNLVEE